jgi:hypothetical protein
MMTPAFSVRLLSFFQKRGRENHALFSAPPAGRVRVGRTPAALSAVVAGFAFQQRFFPLGRGEVSPPDFWDPVKWIPLHADPCLHLSLGGEIRLAYEFTENVLYPRGGYFGDIGLTGPANFINLHPSLTVTTARGWRVYEPIRITRVTRAGAQKAAPRGARREPI